MLSIILVNYNNSHHTINCLLSLQDQTFHNFEVIIVDNNSDEFFKIILKEFLKSKRINEFLLKKIKFIQSNEDLGYTGGNNMGIRASKGNLIALLGNDMLYDPTFLESMVTFFNKYKFMHIAQPKICFYPEKDVIWSLGGKINKFSIYLFSPIDYLKKDKNLKKKPIKIDYANGNAFFIKRSILREIGLFDEIYFMYSEESDLCYRAKLKGYNNIYCNPLIKIYHNTKLKFSNDFKKFYFRNRTIFCFKFFSFPYIIWQLLMQSIQMILLPTDFKKLRLDYNFFLKSFKGIIIGIKIGFIRRMSCNTIK